jgi:DNA-3-methyladenine glycosylase
MAGSERARRGGKAPAAGRRLPRSFYERGTLEVARDILGMRLVRLLDGERLSGRIVEVEAYIGEDDSACHASRGPTPRNRVMFGPPGHAYVYLTYGVHWMLNAVCEREGFPAAILIRAVAPEEGIQVQKCLRGRSRLEELASGPGRLCQAFAIGGGLYGADLVEGSELFIEEAPPVAEEDVLRGPRIGIAYAVQKDRTAPWRFRLRENPFVSRARDPE